MIIQFPQRHQAPPRHIPREEFERLAELALDVVDRIVAMLDEPDEQPQSAAAYESRVVSLKGCSPEMCSNSAEP